MDLGAEKGEMWRTLQCSSTHNNSSSNYVCTMQEAAVRSGRECSTWNSQDQAVSQMKAGSILNTRNNNLYKNSKNVGMV